MKTETVLYQRVIARNAQAESGTKIELTKEINCLLLWRHTWTADTDELVIVRHFPMWDTSGALEFAVDYGRKLHEQVTPPAPPPVHHCRTCGEPCENGVDCCSDEFPEAAELEETGR